MVTPFCKIELIMRSIQVFKHIKNCAPRRMAASKVKAGETCIYEMVADGQINPDDSPWYAPFVLAKKDVAPELFSIKILVKDAYPLPRIDDTGR